jgi:isoleucyl-tRNA synthetase
VCCIRWCGLSLLQTPLKELIIFHSDNDFIEDLQRVEGYIKSELNIHELVFTNDEDRCGVKYKVTADWPTLGRRLRKDLAIVKSGLTAVTSTEVKDFMQSGTLTVNGIQLHSGDLLVNRYVELPSSRYASNTDNDVVLLLDTEVYADMQEQWLARELINRVQKLRKKADLQATDDVRLLLSAEGEASRKLGDMILSQKDTLLRNLRSLPYSSFDGLSGDRSVILSEEQEIGELHFLLSLMKV